MTLSFSTKWGKEMGELAGMPTYFVEKIWRSFTDDILKADLGLKYDEYRNLHLHQFNRSDHPNINRDEITRFVLAEMTIPEIHSRLGNEVTYEEVYDYISDDTYLSNEYRTRGHVRCKSQRK